MSWCDPPQVLLVWNCLCFLDLDVYFLSQLGKFSVTFSSNQFSATFSFSSPSGTPIMQVLVYLMLMRSLKLSSFLKILCLFFCSASVISSTLSSSLQRSSSASSTLLLILSSILSYCIFELCLALPYIF